MNLRNKVKNIHANLSKINMKVLTIISLKIASKHLYKKNFKRKLDLKNPKTFNEKIMWLKLNTYNNNPIITQCVDKYRVREYIENKGYKNILNDLIGVYDNANQITWKDLPEKFVLKCNFGCGYNIICKNKKDIDEGTTKKILNKWMKENYTLKYAEIQYKDVKKKIICEKFLEDDIIDYKFFCFNGIPQFLYVSSGLGEKNENCHKMCYYDCNWNKLNIARAGYQLPDKDFDKPKMFDEMMKISKDLSKDFPFVRVDLFNINDKIYFSELTFIPTGGVMKITPEEKDLEWGNLLKI